MSDTHISFYSTAKDNKGSDITIQAAIDLINSTNLTDVTNHYRSLYAQHTPIIKAATEDLEKHISNHPDFAAVKTETEKKIFNYKAAIRKQEKIDYNEKQIVELHKTNNNIPGYKDFLETFLFHQRTKVENQKILDDYKRLNFPAVTWSALLKKRGKAAEFLQKHSGLICIDIDKLDMQQHDTFKKLLRNDPYIFFMFTSPSGVGLKLIFKIPDDAQQHLLYFEAISIYLFTALGLRVDISGKDVSRLCFLCSDTNCYFNNNASFFSDSVSIDRARTELEQHSYTPQPQKPLTKKETEDYIQLETLFDVHEFTSQRIAYVEGQRNRFIYLFAANACRKGFAKDEVHQFITDNYPDREKEEIKQTVQNAYNDNASEFGKYRKIGKNKTAAAKVLPDRKNAGKSDQQKNVRGSSTGKDEHGSSDKPNNNEATRGQEPAILETGIEVAAPEKTVNGKHNTSAALKGKEIEFWSFKIRTNKNGEEEKRFHIDYNLLKDFLAAHGFYRLLLKDETYQFIKITNNKVKPITPLQIRDFIFHHVEKIKQDAVAHSLTQGGKQYLSTDKFERLPYVTVDIKHHTEASAYFYYQNGMVEVTADEIKLHDYNTLQHTFIWERSINKRTVKIIPGEIDEVLSELQTKSEVYKFIYLASFNENNKPANLEGEALEKFIDERAKKFASICTAIGYLLHQHKTPSKAKAIIAIDHQIPSDRTEQNGGTGKSIIGNYILKNMLNVAYIPGKDYNEMNAWRWEPITIDSQVVFFNDVKYNFNFEGIFELITDDMIINRRNIGYLTIPFDQSPKIYISTNFIPKGDGTSFKRRTHIIEFDNYFNEQHTPYDEFNHNLFADWRGEYADQWNYYDNFIFRCVQMYLQEGLLQYPNGNYEQRKLIAECPQEFIDWMDATKEETGERLNVHFNRWMEKKELLKQWNDEAKSLSLSNTSTAHSFTKMVKKYCTTKKIDLHSKKTGGKEYYSFGAPATAQQNIFNQ